MDSVSWKLLPEKGNNFSIKAVIWLYQTLGRNAVLTILKIVTLYYLLTNQKAVMASKQFLSKALIRPVNIKDIFKHFYYFSVVTLDRINFITNNFTPYKINIITKGYNYLEDQKQGGIFLVSHLGSFEVMRASGIFKKNIPISIIIDRNHNQKILKILETYSIKDLDNIIDSSQYDGLSLVLKIAEKIKQGYWVGVMADRVVENDSIQIHTFLNQPANFPFGIFNLSARLRIPTIACFGIYKGFNEYDLYIQTIALPNDQKNLNKKQLALNIQTQYVKYLEQICIKYPYNWFNFYNFWNEN